jgi:hypothetical protein
MLYEVELGGFAMLTASSGHRRPANRLIRLAVALGCVLALSGCIVYPAGGHYGHPHPYYYGGAGGGYYGHPGWR